MLGLRLDEPVTVADLERTLDPRELGRLERLGLAERHGDAVGLTARGRFLGDAVTAALLA
jgi:coproporphyrinogen III oxidase-like Fe-S oxidoreductase